MLNRWNFLKPGFYEGINHGAGPQELLGWVLHDEASPDRQRFSFEDSYILGPGGAIRVYTNEVHEEWGGFSFGNGTAIWSNRNADTAVLRDATDTVVSTATYDVGTPPGCSG